MLTVSQIFEKNAYKVLLCTANYHISVCERSYLITFFFFLIAHCADSCALRVQRNVPALVCTALKDFYGTLQHFTFTVQCFPGIHIHLLKPRFT